ncbi:hypothetical protein BC828DRAFT_139198 [Blastocladiella britannica]|nr:hypothetical protein BC828DRAFT_139198 [Blastocladiella britannica]
MSETGSRPVEPTSIFVGRLHADTRQEDLSRLFEKHGKIKRCDLKRGGYAFVEFFDSNDARNALVEDGAHLLGESIRVMMAKARMADPGTNGCFRCGSSEHWSKNCPSREEDRGLGLPKWQMAGARGRSRSPPPRSRGGSYSSRRYSRSRSRSPAHRSSRSRRYSRSRSRSPGYRRSSRRDRSRSRSRSPPRRSRRDRSRSRSRSRDRHHRSSRRDRSSSRDRRGRSPSPRRDRDGGRSGSHRDDGEERAPSHSRSPSPAAAVDHMEGVRGRSLSRSPSIERIEG